MYSLRSQLESVKIMPVLTVNSVGEALQVAKALSAGGLKAVEITLRTGSALDAIRAVKNEMPNFIVAAGTVRTVQDMEAVARAGVDFAVSPGFTKSLSHRAQELSLPFLPGISSASELMLGKENGHDCFKLFPAQAVGGIDLLKSFSSPFSDIAFCPTGGISEANFMQYLALPNVLCIGGSWMVAPNLIANKDWAGIEQLAGACSAKLTSKAA
ncbi:MAG: bifunctional 4-hydroxy-2-oxoglutarate aldolase/2-dehydro-3-deoxy-phosphogluconate aldolase [Pseudohongiellaceae bacterium]|nr:bifunctional 4-hydroxy-2-oxoglutarate aldolase/2-dehydro-3-deoxy-phosphogluconate aldolase [Pseudohongiellaceae bacterium]